MRTFFSLAMATRTRTQNQTSLADSFLVAIASFVCLCENLIELVARVPLRIRPRSGPSAT